MRKSGLKLEEPQETLNDVVTLENENPEQLIWIRENFEYLRFDVDYVYRGTHFAEVLKIHRGKKQPEPICTLEFTTVGGADQFIDSLASSDKFNNQ